MTIFIGTRNSASINNKTFCTVVILYSVFNSQIKITCKNQELKNDSTRSDTCSPESFFSSGSGDLSQILDLYSVFLMDFFSSPIAAVYTTISSLSFAISLASG